MKKTGMFSKTFVTALKQINDKTIWLTLDEDLDAVPGQFVMVWLPGIGEKPFSIASMKPLGLLVVDVGHCSHAIHQLKVGDPIWIKGALGHGFIIEGESLLLVGGGYGSAPLLPLAKEALALGKRINVCLGAQKEDGLLLLDNFDAIGCKVTSTTEDGSHGCRGLVTTIVEQEIQDSGIDTLYACGPVGMLSALAGMCNTHRLNYQLSWEAHMRCGMGLCGSCEVKPEKDPHLPIGWLACFDGPVYKHQWV